MEDNEELELEIIRRARKMRRMRRMNTIRRTKKDLEARIIRKTTEMILVHLTHRIILMRVLR